MFGGGWGTPCCRGVHQEARQQGQPRDHPGRETSGQPPTPFYRHPTPFYRYPTPFYRHPNVASPGRTAGAAGLLSLSPPPLDRASQSGSRRTILLSRSSSGGACPPLLRPSARPPKTRDATVERSGKAVRGQRKAVKGHSRHRRGTQWKDSERATKGTQKDLHSAALSILQP